VDAAGGNLVSEVRGEVEVEDGVLVLRRIHVVYRLSGAGDHAEVVRRVHEMHREHCPVYRSIRAAIDVTTELRLDDDA